MSEISSDIQALTRPMPASEERILAPAYPAGADREAAGTPLAAVFRRRWGLIMSTWLLVAGGLSAVVWTYFGSEYEAVGFVRVAPSIRPVVFRDEESGFLPFYNAFMMGQMQNIASVPVLRRAVQAPEVQDLPWIKRTDDPVAYLLKYLKVENPEDSELISVSLRGAEPTELAPTVNAILRAYHEKLMADSQLDGTAQLETLYEERAKLEEELKAQHEELYRFANEVGALSLADQKDSSFAGISQVQIALKQAQTSRVAAEARLDALRQRGPKPLSTAEMDELQQQVIMTDPELASLQLARQMEEERMLRLSQQLGPDHRELRFTRERIERLKENADKRAAELVRSIASLADARSRTAYEAEVRGAEQEYFEAAQTEKALDEVVRADLAQLSTMGKNTVQLQALRDRSELTKQLYTQIEQRIQHLEVEKQRPARVTIDTYATEPTSPARDRRPKLTAMAVVAGLFVALTLAVLVDSRDTRVRSEEDVRRTVGLSVLGTRTIPTRRQVTNKHVVGLMAEEIRGIRGCVLFAGGDQDFQSVLITSPNPQEGKTHTAGELAVALAESGRRTLLIDADNRKRDLTRQLGAEYRPGLAELLENGSDPKEFILTTSTPGLSFLPAGRVSEVFSELLVRPGQMERVRRVFSDYDLVLVDSPPVLFSNEACIWARVVDTVLMVLRVKHSAREEALVAKEKLNQMGGRIMGAVLNGVEHRNSYYGRYAYAAS